MEVDVKKKLMVTAEMFTVSRRTNNFRLLLRTDYFSSTIWW